MPEPSIPPPLRVRNPAGTFNQIPVFELEVSGGTLTKLSPIRARLLIDSGGAGSTTVYAPTGGEYVTYVANNTLTAERVLTAGSSVTIVTDGTNIYVNALTGGGATTVYAATGNQYVTISAAADLTDEYVIQASTGIALTSASNILLVHYGSLLVTSTRAINTTAPLAGGGNLSADRTFTLDTAAMVTSGRAITTVFPLSGGGDLSVDRTHSVSTGGFLVLSSRAINTTAPLAGGGNLSADRTITVDTAAVVTSGRAISTTYPLSGGGNLSADRTVFIQTGAAGTVMISSVGGVGWVTSQNVPQITTVRIPMALATVQPTTGNAYWVGRTSTTIDVSYIEYLDSGAGLSTYWCTVPNNLAPSPLWNLFFYHMPSTGSGGNVVLSVSAISVAASESIGGAALTTVMNAVALSTRAANVLEVSTGSATNFDATLTVAANDYLIAQVWRIGGAAGDTLGQPWDLYALQLRCDVLT